MLSGNGAKAAVTSLCAESARVSGHKVTVDFEVNPAVKKRIEVGEVFDVTVLNPPVLDDLIPQGRVVTSTRTVLGRAGIGAAIREGAPKTDISTVDGFKRAPLGYKSVAYPGEEMKPKMRPMPAELQTWIGFAAGLSALAPHEAAACDMLKFFTTPQAIKILQAAGVDTTQPRGNRPGAPLTFAVSKKCEHAA